MKFLDKLQIIRSVVRARRLPSLAPRIRLCRGGGLLLLWGTGNRTMVQGGISGVVCLVGNNNRLVIGKGARLSGMITVIGNSSEIVVGPQGRVTGHIDIKGSRKAITVGERTTICAGRLLCQEGHSITIGRDCVLARGVEIRTTDAHAVIDRATGRRRNPGRAVQIGDRVRIGADVLVGKGAAIADGTAVEAGSLVIGTFAEADTLIAGVPAKVVRRSVADGAISELRPGIDQPRRPLPPDTARTEKNGAHVPADQTLAIESR